MANNPATVDHENNIDPALNDFYKHTSWMQHHRPGETYSSTWFQLVHCGANFDPTSVVATLLHGFTLGML